MPIYTYDCENDHRFEKYSPMSRYAEPQTCDCGAPAKLVITPPMVFVQPDVHYTSPIDGRPITSMSQRREDLKRNNCSPYDPEQKTDYNRRHRESEARLEKAVEETIDKEISLMSSRKREKLEAELQGGMAAEPLRTTAPAKPIIKQVNK